MITGLFYLLYFACIFVCCYASAFVICAIKNYLLCYLYACKYVIPTYCRPKCTLAASHAAPWWVTVSLPTGQTDRQTDERTNSIAVSARSGSVISLSQQKYSKFEYLFKSCASTCRHYIQYCIILTCVTRLLTILFWSSMIDVKPRPHQQQCRSNVRLCRKNRSTCSIRQCCLCGQGFTESLIFNRL